MLALLKRSALPQKHRIFRYLSRLHAPCGILLLIAGLFHGILAGSTTVDTGTAPEQDNVTFQSFKEQNTTYWD